MGGLPYRALDTQPVWLTDLLLVASQHTIHFSQSNDGETGKSSWWVNPISPASHTRCCWPYYAHFWSGSMSLCHNHTYQNTHLHLFLPEQKCHHFNRVALRSMSLSFLGVFFLLNASASAHIHPAAGDYYTVTTFSSIATVSDARKRSQVDISALWMLKNKQLFYSLCSYFLILMNSCSDNYQIPILIKTGTFCMLIIAQI